MSWDVVLMSVAPEIINSSDLPKDFSSTLGTLSDVLARLKQVLPSIDLSDPAWGLLDGQDFSIEFNIGKNDPVESIMLHVRGSESAIIPIEHLCRETKWRAMGMNDCEFIDFSKDPSLGLRGWQAFSAKVIAAEKAKGSFVVENPSLPGVRVDAIVIGKSARKKWWQFWK